MAVFYPHTLPFLPCLVVFLCIPRMGHGGRSDVNHPRHLTILLLPGFLYCGYSTCLCTTAAYPCSLPFSGWTVVGWTWWRWLRLDGRVARVDGTGFPPSFPPIVLGRWMGWWWWVSPYLPPIPPPTHHPSFCLPFALPHCFALSSAPTR